MIAITFALPVESADLVSKLRDTTRPACGDSRIIVGKLNDSDVMIFRTGVGPKISASRMEGFLNASQPEYLISAGFAGAVSEHLQVGDLLLGENFSDKHLLANAQRALTNRSARTGNLFTSASIVDSPAERNKIARAAEALAVDMETAIIANACAARSVPMLSLRVISDSLQDPLPAPPGVLFDLERQRTNYVRLLSYLVRHPAALSGLARFGPRIARARGTLTEAIVAVATAL
jgi:adenosylhomocysteine nucleosidase